MSLSLQPGVAVPENDTGGSARTPLEMLRGVTRHVATAESLEVVLQSIAAALVGAAGLAISLSLQDLLKNVVAGIYILMEQPFRIGDRISVKDVTGVVQGIELRTTLLRTDEHLQVVVPNNTVLNEIITNRSASSLVRASVHMRLKQADSEQVSSRVNEVLAGIEGISVAPPPDVMHEGIFAGTEKHKINFWVPTGKKLELTSAAVKALQAAFPDADLKVLA